MSALDVSKAMASSDAPRLNQPHLSDVELQMMGAVDLQEQADVETAADEMWRIARMHDDELHPYEVVLEDLPPRPPGTAARRMLWTTVVVSLVASLASLGLTIALALSAPARV